MALRANIRPVNGEQGGQYTRTLLSFIVKISGSSVDITVFGNRSL